MTGPRPTSVVAESVAAVLNRAANIRAVGAYTVTTKGDTLLLDGTDGHTYALKVSVRS